ncbi:MAG: Gmad2 immunoglobulin-like domain-containing protein [Actinomycetota bacterium]
MRTLRTEATEAREMAGADPAPNRRRRRPPNALLGGIALVVAAAAALALPRLYLGGDGGPGGAPSPPPTPSEPEPTSAPPPLPAVAPPAPAPPGAASPVPSVPVVFPGFWPAATVDRAQAMQAGLDDGHQPWLADPEQVAEAFAKKFVGWPRTADARVVSRVGSMKDGWTTIVSFRPMIGEGTLVPGSRHHLGVVGLGGTDNPAWFVAWMRSDEIQVDLPSEGAPTGVMLDIRGKGRAFEGTIGVAVRDDAGGDLHADPGYVMGGGTEILPFSGRVSYARPATPGGILVLSDLGGLGEAPVTMSIVRLQFLDA